MSAEALQPEPGSPAPSARRPTAGGRAPGLSLAALLLAALVGVLLGLSTYTFTYAEGTSYLSNDPRACVNCHIMRDEFDGWQKAAHHARAVCNDCHVPHDLVGKYTAKAVHGYRHSRAFTMQDFHEPIQITPADLDIVQENCLRCHADFLAEVSSHSLGPGPLDCVHCHASVAHGPTR